MNSRRARVVPRVRADRVDPLAEKVVDAVVAEVAARLRERGEERIDGWSPAINWSEAAKLVESEFGVESCS